MNLDFLDDIDELAAPSKVYFLDTNLSSPVLYTEVENTKTLINDLCLSASDSRKYYSQTTYFQQTKVSFLKKLARHRGWSAKKLQSAKPLSPEEYPLFEQECLVQREVDKNRWYDEAREAAQELEHALVIGLLKRGLPAEEIKGTADSLCVEEATQYRHAYEQFSNLFGRASSRVKTSPQTWSCGTVGNVDIWINSDNALLQIGDQLHYSSPNQILMLKDKLSTRFMMLEHVIPLGLDHRLIASLIELFVWQDYTLTNYGNQAYEILKSVEPMFKTWLSHNIDNVFGEDTAYARMLVKLQKKESELVAKNGLAHARSIDRLITVVQSVTETRSIVEMFGCQKSCGHPIVDPMVGGLSAAEHAASPDRTSLVDAQRLRNVFCHIVLTAYIKRHGSWPKLFHARKDTRLKELNDRQVRHISYSSYPLTDWTTTEWTKLFDYDYFPNFLDLMDDKAISLYRHEKHLTWDRSARPSSHRRLLLQVLTEKTIDIEEIVKKVSNRDIPYGWKIVSLYPKEREFKLEPRMFSMLVLEMRCFFASLEANLASNIFKYLPQQTMTKSKTQNQERFLAFTDPIRQKVDYVLFLEIDLTRWNLMWRQLVIHMLGHDINCMFGTPGTFTATHWFFTACQIMVRVPGLRPEGIHLDNPPTTALAWQNHKGGFEGLNQKLWTIATYAMMEMALIPSLENGTISEYEVIGQGDNQVIRVTIPSQGRSREDIIPEVRDILNTALEEACASVNQVVKPEENIESTAVLTYSKDVMVSGVEHPTSLKKHSRLFPVTSLDFPSIASNTRAILAGSVAGGENALYPLRSAIIGHYHAYRYLQSATHGFSIHGGSVKKFSHRAMQAALIIPSSMGGLCGPSFASYFYKGGSDPLGKEVSGLRLLAESGELIGSIASSALHGLEIKYMIDPEPNADILIDNPYGLPLATPASPLSKVGKLTLDAFRTRVTNHDIRCLLNKTVNKSESDLRADILSIRPFNPLLCHDLFAASGFGTIRMMTKMFIHTRTIQGVAQMNNPQITHVFLRADLNELQSFLNWFDGLPDLRYSGKNSFELVSQFRSYWNLELSGVTTYQPLDFTHYYTLPHKSSSLVWSSHGGRNLLSSRGPLSGYIGTATREKRSEHGYKIVDTGAPSRSIMKLQLIRSQAYGSAQFNELLDRISLTRSPVSLSRVTDILPKVIGGSISHRYASAIREMSASYVGPLNFATHIRIDTDNIEKISGSAVNYPVMMQEMIIMTQAGAKMNYIHKGASTGCMRMLIDELEPLQDDALMCCNPQFQSADLPQSKLLYSQTLSVKRTYDIAAGQVPRRQVVSPTKYEELTTIKQALLGFFLSTLRDQNRAKIIADNRGHASLPSQYQLDVAEAHALGPFTIVRSIAESVIITTVRDTFRTIQLHSERWDESLFLAHNIDICVKTAMTYWTHPLFISHEHYHAFRHSALRYSRSMTLAKRLNAAVRREIGIILNSPYDAFWQSDIPVFSGSNESSLLEAVTTRGALMLRLLFVIQDPNAVNFSRLFSSYMRVTHKLNAKASSLLETVRLRCTQLSKLYADAGDHTLSSQFIRLSQMEGVKVFNDDYRTVLRNARSLTPNTARYTRPLVCPDPNLFIVVSSHCRRCVPDTESVNTVIWNRNKVRKNGGNSTAGYTWLPLVSSLSVRGPCLVVGNGNGGLSDLLITCFKCDVIGLDLESDMPIGAATLLNYIPHGIDMSNRPKFLQSDYSISTSGDWRDENVRESVLNSLPGLSTVFIDTTGPTIQELVSSVCQTMEHSLVARVYLRLIGPSDELFDEIDNLRTEYQCRVWVYSRSLASTEAIVEVSRSELPLHVCGAKLPVYKVPLSDAMHNCIQERWSDTLESAVMSSFRFVDETLEEAFAIMENLCISLLNKSDESQLSYRDRYGLFMGYFCLYAATSESPVEVVQSWIADEEVTTPLVKYKLNDPTTTHLLRHVSRLSARSVKTTLAL